MHVRRVINTIKKIKEVPNYLGQWETLQLIVVGRMIQLKQ